MDYYYKIIAFSRDKISYSFKLKGKHRNKVNATKLARDLKKTYPIVFICHNQEKSNVLLSLAKNSTEVVSDRPISIF